MAAVLNAGVLRSIPLLACLNDADYAELSLKMQRRTYRPRQYVFSTGDALDGLYVILSGHLYVLATQNGGDRDVVIELLGPNSFFGEIELVDGKPRCAAVQAVGDCECAFLPSAALIPLLRSNWQLLMLLTRTALHRLEDARDKIRRLALMDVKARVALTMLEHSRDEGEERCVAIGAEQIARFVGASREMVSRAVGAMIEAGIVKRSQRKLFVLHAPALAALVYGQSTSARDQLKVEHTQALRRPVAAPYRRAA